MIKFIHRERTDSNGIPDADGEVTVDAHAKLVGCSFRDTPAPGTDPTGPVVDGWSGTLEYHIWSTAAAAKRRKLGRKLIGRRNVPVTREDWAKFLAPSVLGVNPNRGDIEAKCDALAISIADAKPAGWTAGEPLVSFFENGVVV